MRTLSLLALATLAAVPAAAQGIVVPVRCTNTCPASSLPSMLAMDSVRAWANLQGAEAATYVTHVFRNGTAETLDAALFFPLPADAVLTRVTVVDADVPAHDGKSLLAYNEWTGPDEARWIAEGIVRERPGSGLRAYAGMPLVHVAVRAIPAGGARHVQVGYTQALQARDGAVSYRYPLSAGAAAAPIGHLALGMEVKSEHGFRDLRSPSHAVDIQWGTESGRCRPEAACGFTNVPSQRVKVVRLREGTDVRARDLEVVYTLADAAAERRNVSVP